MSSSRPAATLVAVLLACIVAAASAQSTEQCCGGPGKVQAKGVAYVEVVQNFTLVQVTVYSEGQSAFEVQAAAASDTKAVLDFLASKGDSVSRVQSTSASLSPQFGYDNNGSRFFQKYMGTATVSFEVPEVFGDVLDAIQKVNGATIESISRKENYNDLVAAQQTAVKNAVYDGQQNGKKILESLGKTPGKILSVEASAGDYLQNGGGSLQVIRADATVVYEIVD
jgi:uncharacterized protein YggE